MSACRLPRGRDERSAGIGLSNIDTKIETSMQMSTLTPLHDRRNSLMLNGQTLVEKKNAQIGIRWTSGIDRHLCNCGNV
jgi:hypothetical protein